MENGSQSAGSTEHPSADRFVSSGTEELFDALCREHPEHAQTLRELQRELHQLGPLLRRVGLGLGRDPGGSFAERLREQHGPDVNPAVSLAVEQDERPSQTSELLERLSRHALKRSRYALRGEIARGGMGAILRVWDEDLRRNLAMKVILDRGEPLSSAATSKIEPSQLSRFLEEAQVTGQLDHPGVVPVHELGLDADGRVYFTMKLVKGRDLKAIFDLVFREKDGWNETRALSVILRACEAMAYAHAKGVIHRDLKPANIMVGGFGEVYVMDWGLARVLGQPDRHDVRIAPELATSLTSVRTERREQREEELSDSPLVTMDGDVVGTPAYMAPEQARGEVAKLSPRSDVYALGAMLYHLLARYAPYASEGLRASNRTVLAMVLNGPPARLSSVRKDVPAELVAICEKAMAREPERRYRDTLELAEDLRAYLEHRVVAAYETGGWAETRKWIERNKPLAASLAAAILLLVAGLSASLIFKARADDRAEALLAANTTIERQNVDLIAKTKEAEESAQLAESRRQEAEGEKALALAEKAKAEKSAEETRIVADFQSQILSDLSVEEFGHSIVVEMREDLAENLERVGRNREEIDAVLASFDAAIKSGNPTNVAHGVLEANVFGPAVAKTETEYRDAPLLAAMLQTALGETLRKLGLADLGAQASRAALAARREDLGDEHPDTLDSMVILATLLHDQGDFTEAERLFREAVAGSRVAPGGDHRATQTSIVRLANLLHEQGKLSEAEPLLREALAGDRAELGDDHPSTLTTINNLAGLLQAQGKLSEAEPLYREALAGQRAKLGDDHHDTLASISNLALLLRAQGRLSEAEPLAREALTWCRAKLGDVHPDTLTAINNLGLLLEAQGKPLEAEPLYREALAGCRDKLADDHPDTLTAISSLGNLLRAQGKFSEAEPLLREALAGFRAKLGDDHPTTLISINNLGLMLKAQGRLPEAEPLYREALAGFRAKLGDDHPTTLTSINNLSGLLRVQGKLSEAEQLLREVLAGRRVKLGDDHPDTLISIDNLGTLSRAQGKLLEAESLCREALAGLRDKLGDDHPSTLSSFHNLADALSDQGKLTEAEPLYREAVAGRRKHLGDGHPHTLRSVMGLAITLQGLGEFAEAESLLKEAVERGSQAQKDPAVLRGLQTKLRDLYRTWHALEPAAGHDRRAEEIDRLLEKE